MRSIEISARTVAEAARLALQQLGVEEEDALIMVLQTGDDQNEALVRVTVDDASLAPPDAASAEDVGDDAPASDAVATPRRRRPFDLPTASRHARTVLEGILEYMGLEAYVNVQHVTAVGPNGEDQTSIQLDVEGLDEETVGLMIGRRGETLRSLQFLLNTIVQRSSGDWPHIVVDIGNYRQRRQESLEGLSRRIADQVRQTGRSVALEPMQPYDRRVIHMVLRDHEHVRTESTGEGEMRRVTVHPRR